MTSILGFFIPSGPELWIVLAIVLLLFGHRIPAMARSMGSGIVEFKKGLKDSDGPKDPPPPGVSASSEGSEAESAAKQPQDTTNSNG